MPSRMPEHVAIIMDGNGRWAQQQGKPRHYGHRAGVESVRSVIEACGDKGIKVLTLFAFSSENWQRPKSEVSLLMELFLTALKQEVKKLDKNNVRMQVIGDTSAFPPNLQKRIGEAEKQTRDNDGLLLQIAANYGGKWDITRAAQQVAAQVKSGSLQPEEITEAVLASQLSFADQPDPDLFIRTGGEHRISNFLLWQSAYSELYFTEVLWPDFDKACFDEALDAFSGRQRRYGKTGNQVAEQESC
ncbi:MAG: isoprenyl transferase [bacterium]